jgi:hypothetical protein
MQSVPIPPEVLAHLIRGGSVVLKSQTPEEDLEIYVLERPDLTGTIGHAILEVLPFIGEKQ